MERWLTSAAPARFLDGDGRHADGRRHGAAPGSPPRETYWPVSPIASTGQFSIAS